MRKFKLENAFRGGQLLDLSNNKYFGFTLAEVLITLGIIGVVAALSLSTIIPKYKEFIWVNKFKQTYSVLSELYMNAINENGGTFPEDICNGITVKKQCADKIVDFLIKDNSNIRKVNWEAAMPRYYYDIVNTKTDNQMYRTHYSWFKLNNGASVGIEGSAIIDNINSRNNRYFPFMFVDLNGISAPNKLGHDQFLLYLKKTSDGKYKISGYDLWWVSPDFCNPFKKVRGWTNGGACAIWLIRHGNMDYLHKEIKSW